MTADVRVETGGAELARPLLNPICNLYDGAFSAPPFFWREDESELHRQRLLRLLDDSTFGIAVAQAADELVGFAYGFTVPPDTARWSNLVEPAEPTLTAEWPGRTFLLFDYAVQASCEAAASGEGCMTPCWEAVLRSERRSPCSPRPSTPSGSMSIGVGGRSGR